VSAHAVADVSGDFDYDGDGRREEINIGCESCHGPGSEHVEASTRGLHIVSPSLLTPERETLLCGRCHSRPLGRGAGQTAAPLSEDGRMPLPGLRRAELAATFTTRVDGEAADFHPSGDAKAHHAQYSDFIRSTMYRNGSQLMTCSSCHDAHGSDQHPHSLRRAPDDNAACTGCHSQARYTEPRDHVERATGFVHDGSAEADFNCTRCHMVRTVASGARHPELLDRIPDAERVQYFHGDVASHRFSVTPRAEYAAQPVASTLACGFCHGEQLPNP
jgi:predicted CXXCH cytochrome family protein